MQTSILILTVCLINLSVGLNYSLFAINRKLTPMDLKFRLLLVQANSGEAMGMLGTRVAYTNEGSYDFLSWVFTLPSSLRPFNSIYLFNYNMKPNKQLTLGYFATIIFVSTLEDINQFLKRVTQLGYNENVIYVFIFPEMHVAFDLEKLKTVMEAIWNTGIWRFCVFYYTKTSVNQISYSPFVNRLMNYTDPNETIQTNQKFQNLHGYVINIIMINDPPRNIIKDGAIESTTVDLLQEIVETINATLKIHEYDSFDAAHAGIMHHQADLTVITTFYGVLNDVKYTEPFKRDDLVVMVRKSYEVPAYVKIVNIFNTQIWGMILGMMLIMFVIISLNERYWINILLKLVAALLNAPNLNFNKYKMLSKYLFMLWIALAMFISMVFTSSIVQALIAPQYYPEIDTLDALRQSKIRLCIQHDYIKTVTPDFQHQMIGCTIQQIYDGIISGNVTFGYVVMRSYTDGFNKALLNKFGVEVFNVVDETFVPGFGAFYLYQSSPYIFMVNDLLKRFEECGLGLFGLKSKKQKGMKLQPLTLNHLGFAFILLTLGYGIGLLMLIGEIWHKKYN